MDVVYVGGGLRSSREVGFPDLFCQVLVSAWEGSDYSQSVPLNRFVMVCVKQMSQELLFFFYPGCLSFGHKFGTSDLEISVMNAFQRLP